jgi:hypothetical protein
LGQLHAKSLLRIKGSSELLPTIRTLLKAFANADPPPNRQKAITPKPLQKLFALLTCDTSSVRPSAYTHTADLVLGALRLCYAVLRVH